MLFPKLTISKIVERVGASRAACPWSRCASRRQMANANNHSNSSKTCQNARGQAAEARQRKVLTRRVCLTRAPPHPKKINNKRRRKSSRGVFVSKSESDESIMLAPKTPRQRKPFLRPEPFAPAWRRFSAVQTRSRRILNRSSRAVQTPGFGRTFLAEDFPGDLVRVLPGEACSARAAFSYTGPAARTAALVLRARCTDMPHCTDMPFPREYW
jgi:hypothetical protein